MNRPTVLIVSTGDSCRSQMAAGFLRQVAGDRLDVFTAGMQPSGELQPLAVKIMAEVAIDISAQKPTAVSEYLGKRDFDYLVTVTTEAEGQIPQSQPGVGQRLHWSFDNPATAEGAEFEKLRMFRCVRNEIAFQVKKWVYGDLIKVIASMQPS
ncbi:MAG TPA: arsenate reductase ArsC [Pirellulaceae bacterium]